MKIKLEVDYAVIGSGAAGGIILNELKNKNLDCILIEKGSWYNYTNFKKNFLHSAKNLWVNAGYQFAEGSSLIPILQGTCVGGSTVINGAIMQKIDTDYVRIVKNIFRNNIFDIQEVNKAQDELIKLFKIKSNTDKVIKNSLLHKVCEDLKWKVTSQLRSAPQCKFSEHCLNGCPNNSKLTIENLILKKNFKNVLSDTVVHKLKITQRNVNLIECENNHEKFFIKAKKIILSAGVIGSPQILLKSKIKNKYIGKNFQCHLSTSITADFGERKNQIDILPMGYQVQSNDKVLGTFFSQSIPEELLVSKIPVYFNDLLKLSKKVSHLSSWVNSTKSISKGDVNLDIWGNTKIKFSPKIKDLKKILLSNIQVSKFLFKLGAKKLYLPFNNFPICQSLDDLKKIKEIELNAKNFLISSSHLFGTCSPNINKTKGVIDGNFKVKDIDNLYVIDASSLPVPTAYNPQLTIMIMAKLAIKNLINKFNK